MRACAQKIFGEIFGEKIEGLAFPNAKPSRERRKLVNQHGLFFSEVLGYVYHPSHKAEGEP